MRRFLAKIAATLAAVGFAVSISTGAFAASEFEGKWQVKDTKGKPFEITLSQDGTAKGNRTEEGLKGTWKAVGDAILITLWRGLVMKWLLLVLIALLIVYP